MARTEKPPSIERFIGAKLLLSEALDPPLLPMLEQPASRAIVATNIDCFICTLLLSIKCIPRFSRSRRKGYRIDAAPPPCIQEIEMCTIRQTGPHLA